MKVRKHKDFYRLPKESGAFGTIMHISLSGLSLGLSTVLFRLGWHKHHQAKRLSFCRC